METCHHCGTVLPKTPGARYCPNCGEMSVPVSGGASDPTQAFAAVGANGQGGQGAPSASSQNGMTWELPLHTQGDPTQAIPTQAFPAQAPPAQSAPPEPDPFDHLYRPEGGEPPRPNATQVMAPVPADFGRAEYGYDQPAYDQPIDYQAAGGGAYAEPYENGYADDYPDEPGSGPSPNRGAKIGIGVAAGAVLVIVISLITLGGHSSTPSAGPANSPQTVTTPSETPSSASQASAADAPTTSSPSSSASSPAQHTPGLWQLGDSGPEVKWIQTRLHQLGLYNGAISGTFDQATQAAVAAFQNRVHPADASGVVGRSTRTALIAAGSKPTLMGQLPGLPGDKHHKGGASAADVKRLQQALASALNSNLKATGQFDVDTFGAVVQYQSAMGMAPDGVVNGTVWAALQQGRITG
jgi:peptidoglycan hydrolase-like protein with peptidoglycan-binding domain